MNFINDAFNLFPMYIYKNVIVDTPSIPSLPSLPSFPIETPYVPTAQLPLEALEKAKSLGAQLCASLSREQLCADFSNSNDYFAKPIQLLCSLDIPLTAKVCFGGLVKTGDYAKYAGLALVVVVVQQKYLVFTAHLQFQ
ncbi:MAG: hypothetical protein JSS12_06510 [Verrucomicrobia bacterium]|nr:hypothetical protein [Verrucomicrobiota bacterium]